MKVILMEDIPSLGAMGAAVEVAKGYARNYLIPQGKAVEATAGNLARVEAAKVRYAQTKAKEQEKAQALVARLEGVSLTIAQRVGEEGRLYGSVTTAMVAEALAAQGFDIDRKQLELPEIIKQVGAYEVTVRLAPAVKGKVSLEVVPEGV